MLNYVPAKIVRIRSSDRLYELHPSMLGKIVIVDPVPFIGTVQHYKRRSWWLRWLRKDQVVLIRRRMFHVKDGGAYPTELLEFWR